MSELVDEVSVWLREVEGHAVGHIVGNDAGREVASLDRYRWYEMCVAAFGVFDP